MIHQDYFTVYYELYNPRFERHHTLGGYINYTADYLVHKQRICYPLESYL